MIIKSATVLCV